MTYREITLQEFDNLCKTEKGWVRNRSGYEYVYDYRVPNTNVMIKILSSVNVETEVGRNKGSDAIRVYAVTVDKEGKVTGGLLKAIRINRVEGWEKRVIDAFIFVRKKAIGIKKKTLKKG
jgi:hypothetical protein